MNTTTFVSEDISCEGCANAIKKAVGALPGVSDVSVDVEKQEIRIHHEATVAREALAKTLDNIFFQRAIGPIPMRKTSGASSGTKTVSKYGGPTEILPRFIASSASG